MSMGTLYIVATPIGNMSEITFRAVEVLKSVDMIACEDTRHSLPLLDRYEIKKPLVSYHKFNELERTQMLIGALKEGKSIALISDAGMPLISDPGFNLVKECEKEGITLTCISGACALVNALVLSGLSPQPFVMLGFLPDKTSERRDLLQAFKLIPATLIFYCAPHNLCKDLAFLGEELGDRKMSVVREISKKFEEVYSGSLLEGYPKEPRGEFVVLIEGAKNENPLLKLSLEEHLEHYISMGVEKKDAIKMVAKDRGVAKSEVYKHSY